MAGRHDMGPSFGALEFSLRQRTTVDAFFVSVIALAVSTGCHLFCHTDNILALRRMLPVAMNLTDTFWFSRKNERMMFGVSREKALFFVFQRCSLIVSEVR